MGQRSAAGEQEGDIVEDDTGVEGEEQDGGKAGDEQEDDATAGAGQDGDDAEGAADEEDGDAVVITIGDEEPPADEDDKRAPTWVRDLRKSNREKDRRLREQEAEIARLKGGGGQAPATIVLGPKPTMQDPDIDFDADKFEASLTAWHERKRQIDDQATQKQRGEDEAKASWQSKLDAYGKAKATLKVRDFDDAEAAAQDTFSVIQQGVILSGLDGQSAATMVYALGKNPKKAKELAAISDPVKFAIAIGELRTQVKTAPRKSAPTPERVIRSSVPGAAAVDNELSRLRTEAEKTGDLSKVLAYKNAQRAKARA